MSVLSIIAIYFVVWWIVLFTVLPWGMRTQEEEGKVTLGTTASAPANPRFLRKVIATSIAAAVLTFAIWFLIGYLGYGVEEMGAIFLPRQ
jgi:predicted secreted protein